MLRREMREIYNHKQLNHLCQQQQQQQKQQKQKQQQQQQENGAFWQRMAVSVQVGFLYDSFGFGMGNVSHLDEPPVSLQYEGK